MRCGEIILLEYPFTDDSGSKWRPALIVSAERFNQGEDVVVVPISSRLPDDDRYEYVVRRDDEYFDQTGLRFPSSIKWTKPLTISQRLAKRRLGALPGAPLSAIIEHLRSMFEC